MEFTYQGYRGLIAALRAHGYRFVGFDIDSCHPSPGKNVILRHDIDFSLQQACQLSNIEAEENVPSTWFVLVNTNFYNICSRESRNYIAHLQKNGGTIGLHFDESQYQEELAPLRETSLEKYSNRLCIFARQEADILEQITQAPVKSIAYHCPAPEALALDINFPSMVNAYGKRFFREFKYLSDSRMHWREDVDGIVASERFQNLQILTHAFWYSQQPHTMHDHLFDLCKRASAERYYDLSNNFSDLEEVLTANEIIGG